MSYNTGIYRGGREFKLFRIFRIRAFRFFLNCVFAQKYCPSSAPTHQILNFLYENAKNYTFISHFVSAFGGLPFRRTVFRKYLDPPM